MGSRVMTVTSIERAEIKNRTYLLADYDGLYLKIYPTGKKKWVIRHSIGGRDTQITIGQYPQMCLSEARHYRDNYKAHLKYSDDSLNEPTLGQLYVQWFETVIKPNVAPKTAENISLRFSYSQPLHRLPLSQVSRGRIIDVLNAVAKTHGRDTVKRTAETIRRVLNYAIDLGKLTVNPAMRLEPSVPALHSWKRGHFAAALSRPDIKNLLDAVDSVNSVIVRNALKFIAYTFVRSGELRQATWNEINFSERLWLIPAEHTKLRRDQLVPLSAQSLSILSDMEKTSRKNKKGLIFPATRGTNSELARGTMLIALRTALSQSATAPIDVTVHGFRATASTLLHEAEFDHFVIERQLAHVEKNAVSAAYNRALYLTARRKMMQWYADALDAIQFDQPLPEKP